MSNSDKCTEKSEQDVISNLPTEITDKILKRLPIKVAAKMSILSKKWRHNWMSIRYIVFDESFWREQCDRQKINYIISHILRHHDGPLHKFYIYIPMSYLGWQNIDVDGWLYILSGIDVKKIILDNHHQYADMPSHIFACKMLVKLSITCCLLKIPPPKFEGFPDLRILEIFYTHESNNDIITRLIASCPQLTDLKILYMNGPLRLSIDVPKLENLAIQGVMGCLAFENLHRMKRCSLRLISMGFSLPEETRRAIKSLANSEIEYLHFGRNTCELLALDGTIPLTLQFNHLQELSLTQINLGVIDFTFRMLQCCPFIKNLKLSIDTITDTIVEHNSKYEYDNRFTMKNLVKVEIEGITGSSAELKLIEYVLSVSVVLEVMSLKFYDTTDEVEMLRELLYLPRASTKAKIICLQQ